MPDSHVSTPGRPSGRPQSIHPDSVARIALELFDQHGYTQVSMAQIAEACCIGRKSLYRYFPSKTDLVWGGALDAISITEAALELEQEKGHGPIDSLRNATLAGLRSIPDLDVARGRLRLIAGQPELLSQASLRMAPDRERTAHFFRKHGVSEEQAEYLTIAFGAVVFTACIRWAQSESPDPEPFLRRATAVLQAP
ncbi:TetR/AcrR family transcriptional regulator [Glutamicibacter sp. JL.03c]|uniref:TetR/AcrR family transcriptional regulator n=1 Tax=Glutamicibacter sp. JL.03c TaxID=2984842 RepID=UPI0021F6B7AF|nr:TetR/AcrR family transcriptional regulator [Glutamicibacter sp. JL.03c]UYQ77486.1 TetR/AcrR family transcriptional regulator [Glutamicibacter sp. JL.03c]